MQTILDTTTHKIEVAGAVKTGSEPIRVITTGSMQRRFTITEEVFIESDDTAKVIKSRLINASYCDLDYQDTIDGVNYICGVLKAGGIIADEVARASELLADGTKDESIDR